MGFFENEAAGVLLPLKSLWRRRRARLVPNQRQGAPLELINGETHLSDIFRLRAIGDGGAKLLWLGSWDERECCLVLLLLVRSLEVDGIGFDR